MPGRTGKPPTSQPATVAHAPGADAHADKHGLLLIIVGSSIAAEVCDRPLAYLLRERVQDATRQARSDASGEGEAGSRLQPLVCTDMWYLNDRELDARPAIAIGDPSRNAATAMLCARLPTAMVIERAFRVHLDPEFIDTRAAIWGIDAKATAAAIELFIERYLPAFLAAAG